MDSSFFIKLEYTNNEFVLDSNEMFQYGAPLYSLNTNALSFIGTVI